MTSPPAEPLSDERPQIDATLTYDQLNEAISHHALGAEHLGLLLRQYRREAAELRATVAAIVARWDECLPHIQNAEEMAWVHGWRYQGPEGGMKAVIEAARLQSKEGS